LNGRSTPCRPELCSRRTRLNCQKRRARCERCENEASLPCFIACAVAFLGPRKAQTRIANSPLRLELALCTRARSPTGPSLALMSRTSFARQTTRLRQRTFKIVRGKGATWPNGLFRPSCVLGYPNPRSLYQAHQKQMRKRDKKKVHSQQDFAVRQYDGIATTAGSIAID